MKVVIDKSMHVDVVNHKLGKYLQDAEWDGNTYTNNLQEAGCFIGCKMPYAVDVVVIKRFYDKHIIRIRHTTITRKGKEKQRIVYRCERCGCSNHYSPEFKPDWINGTCATRTVMLASEYEKVKDDIES